MLAARGAAHVQMDSDGLRYEAVSAARKLVCTVNMVRCVIAERLLASMEYDGHSCPSASAHAGSSIIASAEIPVYRPEDSAAALAHSLA